ncbi:hypothetical protein BBI01_10240 [Chryseobacterium artocarpi]|uniref:Uncharacterized protein n=2 Tax=Chryseobacterium artocarpi TaxID=1414727 RepID=A0A1B8ZLL0_9FLAO|nr:hypothetical protein BBI01_10240 [Chryseobacterium artocarpi]
MDFRKGGMYSMIRFENKIKLKIMGKSIIILIISSLVAVACNDKANGAKTEIPVKVDSSKMRKKEAVVVLDEVQHWMKKGVTKKLSTNKVNKEINPLMEKYQKLLEKMNKQDSTEIQNYRVKLINELIDLQIQQK